ncbi:cupin domain-containing protein [Microbacterium sp. X-17]|uniref:cupin domain-containing protein n=1 Tax=Microbacterium sp. X-17 TaxID=3144404 RepID=UPI0031F4CCA0
MLFRRGRVDQPVRLGSEVGSTSGDVLLDTVLQADGIAVNYGVFKPGARTFWHTHSHGQLFFIDGGRGMIATREDGIQVVAAGDIVWTPPGEEHWHGASPDTFVTYKAISMGTSTFLREVTDEEFARTWA